MGRLHISKVTFVLTHDLCVAAVSLWISLYLRVGAQWENYTEIFIYSSLAYAGIAAITFSQVGLYKGIWRYASTRDLMNITKAVSLSLLVLALALFLYSRLQSFPRSIFIINWFVMMTLLGAPRFLYRMMKDRRMEKKRIRDNGVPVLLLGAGDECDVFIRSLETTTEQDVIPVGILAEKQKRIGRDIRGVPVLGTIDQLEEFIAKFKTEQPIRKVILTKDKMVGEKIADILKVTEKLGLPLNRLPRMQDLQSAAGQKIQLKPVAIEDLLGRPQAVLDRQAMSRIIVGKRILVTGAGGSIGSELVRQISDFHPAAMALVDAGEFNLYSIDMELGKRHPQLQKYPMLADVRAYDRLQNIFHIFQPDLVVHAAALKHVPLVEENPLEGMQTNCFGTQNVVDACCAHGVKTMVMISTDKAVNPTNIMGATKRVAEQYCQAVDAEKLGPRIVTVRFGNVLGSTGSVVPLFTKQLEDGGPLTVTHPDVERYFMTIREAVELVLQAAAVGVELEDLRGKIFVLDMGSPVKIVDLARQMIRLSGLRPETDIQIAYTGLRPGEKLFEEIFHGAEPPVATQWDGLLIASPRTLEVAEVRQYLQDMKACCQSEDLRAAIACLKIMVPELGPDHRPNSRPDHDKATAIDASEKIAE